MPMPENKITVYNTLTRSNEPLVFPNGRNINFFVCGQTVYDDAHLGHAKAYINYDIIVRWLRHSGYVVNYIQNITDVEDKIIKRAQERNISPEELSKLYGQRLMEDMEKLGVTKNINKYPKSHDYIDEMKMQIQLLFDKGYAYELDGDIYYDVAKFPDYTKLSGMKLEELEKHRIEPKPGKKHEYDFALWKAAKPGEPSWKITLTINGASKEFSGRPGWHIEDTAITHVLFGETYDIHGGARELVFPHHSNEIAQAEAAFGVKPFVRYWVHAGMMNIGKEKMSKSLHNFVTIRQTLEKYDPETIRLLIARTHYIKDMDYKESLLEDAASMLNFLRSSMSMLYNAGETDDDDSSSELQEVTAFLEKEFTEAMNDNFNTPLALTKLQSAIEDFRKIAETNTALNSAAKKNAVSKVVELSSVIGIFEDGKYKRAIGSEERKLIEERDRLRKEKKYEEADTIRNKLLDSYSLKVEDSKYGTLWYYVN